MHQDLKKKRTESSDEESEERKKRKLERKLEKLNKKLQQKQQNAPEQKITMEDYFLKYQEFRLWLLNHKHIRIEDDLKNTEEIERYFKKFVKRWNNGDLSSKYYSSTGVHSSDLSHEQRTNYKWNLKNLSLDEEMKLDLLRDKVDTNTFERTWQSAPDKGLTQTKTREPGPSENESILQRENQRAWNKFERKKHGKEVKEVNDELVPRADPGSFAAKMEKKKQANFQRRELENSKGEDEGLEDSDIYGTSDSSFSHLLKLQEKKQQRGLEKKKERANKLKTNEESERLKMEDFKKKAGLE